MSEYLDPPLDTISTDCVFKSTHAYILDEFRSQIDIEKIHGPKHYLEDGGLGYTQFFMDNCKNSLRMYGSAEDLEENVKIFRAFPDTHRYYRTDHDPYFTSAVIYHNLNGDRFVSKQDLLIILQNMALRILPDSFFKKKIDIRVAVHSALKGHEMNHLNNVEFVRFDERVFEEMERDVREMIKTFVMTTKDLRVLERQMSHGAFHKLYAKYPQLVKNKEEDRSAINSIRIFYKGLKRRKRVESMMLFLNKTLIIKHLIHIIETRPHMFFPYSDEFNTRNSKVPITVRLFEDGEKQFVMKAELFHALGQVSGKKSKFKEEQHLFTTVSWQEVLQIYGTRIERLEFIRTPILRAKHRSVPVRGHQPTEFGQLAVDALFDMMRSLIVGSRTFEKNKSPEWEDIHSVFTQLECIFRIEHKNPYFIREGMLKQLLANFENVMRMTETIETNEIRDVGPGGFDPKDLEKELIYLGLTQSFPEILETVPAVYEAVMRTKRGEKLRTCDMFEAVEKCQMICVFEKLPKIKKFLHNQGGCKRVPGLKCDECEVQDDTPPTILTPLKIETTKGGGAGSTVFHSPAVSHSGYDECFLDETEMELNTSRAKLEDFERKMVEKEKELAETKSNYRKVVEEKKWKLEEKQKEIENLKKKIERFSGASKEIEELNLKISELEASCAKNEQAAQRAQTKYTTRITQLEAELSNGKKKTQKILQDKIQEMSMENQQLLELNFKVSEELEAVKTESSKISNELEAVKAEKTADKKQKEAEWEKKKEEMEKALDSVKIEAEAVKAENTEKEAEWEKKESKHQEEVEQLKKELAERIAENEQLKTELVAVKAEKKEISEKKPSPSTEINEQLTKLKADFDQSKIVNSKKLLDKEKELVGLKYDHEQAMKQKMKELEGMKKELAHRNDELMQKKKELAEKNKELEKVKRSVDKPPYASAVRIEELRAKIVDLEESISQMKDEHSSQEATFHESQSELFTRISCLEAGLSTEIQKSRSLEQTIQKAAFDNRMLHEANVRLSHENLSTGNAIRETIYRFTHLSFSYTQ